MTPGGRPVTEAEVLQRELAYHEKLYSGFAQAHFAKPAVRALRAHMVERIVGLTGAGRTSRVLSLGCGIGDTELLLAPRVESVTGVDLSPAAIEQARADAQRLGIANATFIEGCEAPGRYDVVIAIFFLHHLPDAALAALPTQLKSSLEPGGVFYSLDPSRQRLSGAIGRLVIPWMMKRYQTPDERELDAAETAQPFRDAGYEVRTDTYDFVSSPFAGLLPSSRVVYAAARAIDDRLLRIAGLRKCGSNFELICRAPRA